MRRRGAVAIAVIALLLIAGIAYLGSFASGELSVYVRDAPAAWKHLTVVFSDIQVHRAAAGNDSGWLSLPLVSPEIDFAAIGNLTKLLALDRATAGMYTQLRLTVDSVTGVLANGTPVKLLVPDHVLKTTLPFEVPAHGAVRVTIDFDLASSIHEASGVWIFRPVLGAIQVS